MIAVMILMVIFGGIALITYVDNTTKAQRRLPKSSSGKSFKDVASTALGELAAPATESLILRLPTTQRNQAWNVLSLVIDAQSDGPSDSRSQYLLAQTRETYLPDTLNAYLNLTAGAKQALMTQGQPAELLLTEQLTLMEDGVKETLKHDHAAADRLLTQGRFLRERFSSTPSELVLTKSK